MNTHKVILLLIKLFRYDRSHVRKLLARGLQNLLAHHLGYHQPQRLVRQFVFIKDGFALRQILNHLREQGFDHISLKRRDWNNCAPVVLMPVPLHQRQKPGFIGEPVGLIQEQERRLFRLLHEIEHEAVAVTR